MLTAKNRLTGRRNFEKIKDEGNLYKGKAFGLVVLKTEKENPSRFAFIVSTKISKKAVERNRVKRKLKEAVRQLLGKINNGFDVLFLAKKSLLDKTDKEIKEETEKLFKEAGITK